MDIKILESKHPEVKEMEGAWARSRILVEEQEANYTLEPYFQAFPNESRTETQKRKEPYRMGFFNPAQELVATKGEYILRGKIDRITDAQELQAFIQRADKSGQPLNDFIKNQASPNLQAYGTVFGVVDKPRGIQPNKAQELAGGMPYLCILHPSQVLNWAWGEDGGLLWFRYWKDQTVDLSDPFGAGASGDREYITWDRASYFRHDAKGNLVEALGHGFGVVPIAVQASFVMSDQRTLGKTTFFSSSRHLFMGNTHLSKANMEILKYGSILMVHANDWDSQRGIEREIDPETNLPRLTNREAREGEILAIQDMDQRPGYLEKNIEVVEKANAQARWYFSLAAQTEATGQEPEPLEGGNPASGVAKAYDFQDMDANLFSHAQDLQGFETQVMTIVSKILKVSAPFSIKYPSSFDVRGFRDKVAQVADLQRIRFSSPMGLKLAEKRLTAEITNDEQEQQAINDEIDSAQAPEPEAPALP